MSDEVKFPPGWLIKDCDLAKRRAKELGLVETKGAEAMSDARYVIGEALDGDPCYVALTREDYDKSINAILSALDSAGLSPPEWRPIGDGAPKDGTRVLLAKFVGHPAHPTALWWATLGHWSAKWNNWNDGVEPAGLAGPTHWMPLPAPPKEK